LARKSVRKGAVRLPERLKAKYADRFDDLIAEGRRILDSFQEEQVFAGPKASWAKASGGRWKNITKYDREAFAAWKLKCVNLADALVPRESRFSLHLAVSGITASRASVASAIGRLLGLQDIFSKGFLDDLGLKIEAEVASNYMAQAEELIGGESTGKYSHVPAAVLAGAVLEKGLRTLVSREKLP
jgi:hypothetical protein